MSKKRSSVARPSMGPKLNTPSGYFDELCEISSVLCSGLEQGKVLYLARLGMTSAHLMLRGIIDMMH